MITLTETQAANNAAKDIIMQINSLPIRIRQQLTKGIAANPATQMPAISAAALKAALGDEVVNIMQDIATVADGTATATPKS